MIDFIRQGGFFMIPLLLVAAAVVALAARSVVRLGGGRADGGLETGIDAILFWGAWGVVLGLLGTLGGVYQAAGAISAAPEISPGVVWGGIRVALTTTLFGLLVFSVAAVTWFVLRVWYRRTVTA